LFTLEILTNNDTCTIGAGKDIINMGKSPEQIANEEEMANEEKKFALYRRCWEDNWEQAYGFFTDMSE
jgi:hypothetical protein